jgi:N-acetylglucosaminyl-diphospho-decaprenol L-rhamnosyltransferase
MTTSVLIVTYRAAEAAIDCLTSLTPLTKGADSDAAAEIIVVDNASGDGTAERIAARFPQVTLIEAGENLGFARAVNLAAGHATGDVLVLLNPDTIVHDGAIGHLAGFARANPDAGLVGGRTLTPAGELDPRSCWGAPSAWSMVCFATGLSMLFKRNRVLDPESLGRWSGIRSERSASSPAACSRSAGRSGTSSAASTRRSSCTGRTSTCRCARPGSGTAR